MIGAPGGTVLQPANAEMNPEVDADAAAPLTEPAGRKLIVLSDGTGNSERSPFKTNVWRTYQALHLWSGNQIARYDNGIGTSRFRLLAMIGSAFGWGLKRNVLELYKFLSREYRAGDEIFGFGFSRGAFTIRVLMGLIQHQGLVRYRMMPNEPPLSEGSLARYAAAAYRAYRKEHFKAWLTAPARWLRDVAIRIREKLFDIPAYDPKQNVPVASIDIRFLGLWDTVDAYGMPVRELKRAVDIAIWPMTFKNLELGNKVKRACHALALDDERATFHPLLWDELAEQDKVDKALVEPDRIKQVWFAGMHANVGGGYPDDALAHVPLLWIIEEAHDAGLRFHDELLQLYAQAANPRGRIYDSRAGFATFYRYSPRRTDQSADDLPYARRALIHYTALDRVKAGLYAPISIRGLFAKERGGTATAEHYNTEAMELVFDTVWWRRTAYWALVAIAVVLALFPWLDWLWDALGLDGSSGQVLVAAAAANFGTSTLLTSTPLLPLVKAVTPAFAGRWLDSFARNPMPFSLILFLGVCTLVWGVHLRDRAADRAREAWRLGAEKDLKRADFLRGITTRRNPTMRALLLLAGAVLAAEVYLHPERSGPLLKLLPLVPIIYAFGERLSARTTASVRMGAYLPAGPALLERNPVRFERNRC